MPYPDDFSGDRFDAHYGTEDQEPTPDYLRSLTRWVASATIERGKAMERCKDVSFAGAHGQSIVSVVADPDGSFAIVAEHHHRGGRRMDAATCVLSRRAMEEFIDAGRQLLDETKQVIS